MKKKHIIPLGTLVEVIGDDSPGIPNGIRLFVGRHSYDFDGTPLYDLVSDIDYIGTSLEKFLEGVPNEYYSSFSAMYQAKFESGYVENNLKIISSERVK